MRNIKNLEYPENKKELIETINNYSTYLYSMITYSMKELNLYYDPEIRVLKEIISKLDTLTDKRGA